MILRRADPDDGEAVASVFLKSRRCHVAFAPLARSEVEVRDWIRRRLIPEGDVFVIEDDGLVIAMMAISVRDSVGWIDHLYVAPACTNRGYGSRLLAFAKEKLPGSLCLYTFQQNRGARRFYERHGFRPDVFTDGSGNEERCPDVLYRFAGRERNRAPEPAPACVAAADSRRRR